MARPYATPTIPPRPAHCARRGAIDDMLSFCQNRAVLSLAVLVVLGLALGVARDRSLRRGKSFVVQATVRSILAPSQMAFRTVAATGQRAVRILKPRSVLLKENTGLRSEVARLELENARLREASAENSRLRQALQLRDSLPLTMVAAEIISRKESNWFDTATINRGSKAGIAKGDAVITQRGLLVGQILDVDPFTSQIVSITDSSSAIGAMVQRSRSSGILQGQGGDYLILSLFSKDADVTESDVVISSGVGQVIPKGFEIGRVARVERRAVEGTTAVHVRPSMSFDRVEQVLVVKLDKP